MNYSVVKMLCRYMALLRHRSEFNILFRLSNTFQHIYNISTKQDNDLSIYIEVSLPRDDRPKTVFMLNSSEHKF